MLLGSIEIEISENRFVRFGIGRVPNLPNL
jgi:hypothetical protein